MPNGYTLGGPPPQSRSEKILMKQNPGPSQSRIEELLKNSSAGRTAGVLVYKGTVETALSLPASGNEVGDVYHVNSDGSEWAWNGEQWEELGKSIAIDAVLYTPQSLTSAQQEQARLNIGAGTYSKPSGGIPASDLAAGVIPTVPEMAMYANMKDWAEGKVVDASTLKTVVISAVQQVAAKANTADVYTKTEIDNKGYQTAEQVQTAIQTELSDFVNVAEEGY